MDEYIENSIQSRYDSIFNLYDISSREDVDKIDELFSRIREYGNSCKDVSDFETRFATSSLNTDYINLFTEFSTKYQMKDQPQIAEPPTKSRKEGPAKDIADELQYVVTDTTVRPIRGKLANEAKSTMRSMPVVGELMQASNIMSLGKKFKKK